MKKVMKRRKRRGREKRARDDEREEEGEGGFGGKGAEDSIASVSVEEVGGKRRVVGSEGGVPGIWAGGRLYGSRTGWHHVRLLRLQVRDSAGLALRETKALMALRRAVFILFKAFCFRFDPDHMTRSRRQDDKKAFRIAGSASRPLNVL